MHLIMCKDTYLIIYFCSSTSFMSSSSTSSSSSSSFTSLMCLNVVVLRNIIGGCCRLFFCFDSSTSFVLVSRKVSSIKQPILIVSSQGQTYPESALDQSVRA
eukprot:817599_1